MTILIIAFIAGVLTVLAPCVLPLLPVIVGGSVTGGTSKKKAIIVTIALGVSVIAFTFFLKVSTLFINIPQEVWSYISGGIIFILGLVTLFPDIWDKFKLVSKANKESNKALAVGYQKNSIWGDIIIGASLGPVFSTCSPTYFFILATILPLNPALGFIYLIAYTVGLCLALLIIAFVGQKVIEKLGIASDPKGWLKRTLGVIFIIVGVAIFFGYDKIFEAKLLSSGLFDITKVEQGLLQSVSEPTPTVSSPISTTTPPVTTVGHVPTAKEREMTKAQLYKKSPEIVNPSGFINTEGKSITIGEFKGKKVVLIDVWTYSCINCQRTLPYVKAWYDKYHDQGLEIISLHTPEFSFERVQKNVEEAVKRFEIKYPVVLDNSFETWTAFGNQYWPRKYLIDLDGYIVYDHIGEGNYDETEKAIQKALKDRAEILNATTTGLDGMSVPKNVISVDSRKVESPETYFGSARNTFFGNGKRGAEGSATFTVPSSISPDFFYLSGTWDITGEYAESFSENAGITYQFNAKNVYMVASSELGNQVEVYVDGVKVQTVDIKEEKLYTLYSGADYGKHKLELKILKKGLKAFTFTFG